MVERIHHEGTHKGDILVYALSTCVWCKKAKNYFESRDIAYDYIHVDLLEGDDKKEVVDEIVKLNPLCSFPTILINGKCIVGFKEDQIAEALK